MYINSKESACIRFGSRFDVKCSSITTLNGITLESVGVCCYFRRISCKRTDSDNAKANSYRSFNSIFSKVCRATSNELILHLTQSKCVPSLLFGLEACLIYSANYKSLERPLTNIFMNFFALHPLM